MASLTDGCLVLVPASVAAGRLPDHATSRRLTLDLVDGWAVAPWVQGLLARRRAAEWSAGPRRGPAVVEIAAHGPSRCWLSVTIEGRPPARETLAALLDELRRQVEAQTVDTRVGRAVGATLVS